MGLIIGPIMILWLGALFFTLRMGYLFLIDKPLFPYVCVVVIAAILGSLLYVAGGLSTFRGHSELWVFEISWFFLANKYAISLFVLAAMAYLFGSNLFSGDISRAVIFILAFSITSGSLIGSLSASSFMQKYNISATY